MHGNVHVLSLVFFVFVLQNVLEQMALRKESTMEGCHNTLSEGTSLIEQLRLVIRSLGFSRDLIEMLMGYSYFHPPHVTVSRLDKQRDWAVGRERRDGLGQRDRNIHGEAEPVERRGAWHLERPKHEAGALHPVESLGARRSRGERRFINFTPLNRN